MRILTPQAMSAVDRTMIEDFGVPSPVLMENAALAVTDAVAEHFPAATEIAVLCGPGNNGGDGLAIARHLDVRGYRPTIVLATGGKKLSTDAAAQLEICRRMRVRELELSSGESVAPAVAEAAGADLLVDALFGTGLARPLEGLWKELVEGIDRLRVPLLAVDLPSGLAGGTGALIGPALTAEVTVTFAAPKLAHVFPPAADRVGKLLVADIGIPPILVHEAPADPALGELHLVEEDQVAGWLPRRADADHKGDRGHLLVVAGGPGKTGAALLVGRAALRTGAGLVTLGVPRPQMAIVDGGSLETMTVGLPAEREGGLDASAPADVAAAAAGKAALAVGPGLGRSPGTVEAVREIALSTPLPLVLDADGLNAFARCAERLAERTAPTVLTPHPGEAGRLLGRSAGEVQEDRLGAARQLADRTGAVTVLKGHRTLVAARDGLTYVNPSGNPGMATAGTGDLLTGMIAALLAQGVDALPAAVAAVYAHGRAGDEAARRLGEAGMLAGDLLAEVPGVLRRLAR